MTDLILGGAPFLGKQALDLGFTRQTFRRALRENAVRRVLRTVYVDARVEDSTDLRIAALHLVMPPHAVLFGTTAMWVMGIDAFQPEERFVPRPTCVVPHGMTRTTTQGVRTVEGFIEDADVMELGGLRVTVPARTAVDGLRRLRRPFALSAADAMAHAGLVGADEIRERISRLGGFPGIVQARYLEPLIDPATEWPGESWTKLRLVDCGCPIPRSQLWITDVRGRRAAVDLGYEQAKVACEYDGREVHTLDEDTDRDDERRTWLRTAMDWRMAIACKESVFSQQASFELEVAGWLGIEPLLPRQW